jgi:hypothetical protein
MAPDRARVRDRPAFRRGDRGHAGDPLLPILFCAPRGWIERPAFKRSIGALAGALLGLAVLALTIDAFFFGEFNVRLDHKVFSYASGPGNEYLARVIFAQFPVLTALAAVLAVSVGIGWIVVRLGFDDRYNAGSTWHAIVWPTLLTALVALGIRGTLGSHAINTGPAYFGATPSLTQLALNGLFTLREALHTRLTDDVDLASLYDLLPDPEVDRRVRELVLTSADQPIDDPVNPLHRRTEAVRPARNLNVVLVVLEGMHWSYFGHLGGRPGLTPHLDALAEGGVHAEYAFAVGGRTRRGFAGVVSSFPDLPVDSVTTRDDVAGTFLTLPDLLKQRGYQTLFLYGGPALRDHRQTFLGSNGVDRCRRRERPAGAHVPHQPRLERSRPPAQRDPGALRSPARAPVLRADAHPDVPPPVRVPRFGSPRQP